MHKLGDPMTHLRLMCRMGQHVGVDLARAHADGRLSQADWAEMVHACRGCAWGSDCGDWLDRARNPGEAPDVCPNESRFVQLQSKLESPSNV
ncbi:DUF6455 family protein [Aliisedimentitalea scapharcae]|uniref:DUF6455 family protein n=1 Tax=Aliisedimentitalea scapharcae TaxID=1524259 RepID=A0ABZ2XZ63_9RHOB